ncbi:2-hydroxyacid dehydrogenase [Goodfellowiella coeruleoviolacea]|uniref:D-3-phosphoglycerate dehydrogenase n=1 Tax=Goodfellowiella coeruleoviolacea TaxID=334858 RepID=A0AAE3KK23_9PSEU|nr:2-hydroxyacid dehydrogenase [Goodfellowiella coeruleoviolacea]MCP2164978.1 D-3-phosphoglycerate dehydrogenase [Goodfellowiella coeruleoviolacea]
MRGLVVIAPTLGGAKLAQALGGALAEHEITAVEDTGQDRDALRRAEFLLTALAPVNADHLAAAEALRFVQCASHGVDHVDLAAAERHGVTVSTIGSSQAEAQDVAEHAMALMLALAKQLVPGHQALRDGEWALPRLRPGLTELFGKTLGIVGLGAIGQQLARRATAFDMRIVYSGPRPVPAAADYRARHVELDELLATADYVSLHAPLRPDTRHLLDRRRLALMKPTAILVNTARGALVDQDALAEALAAGRLGGAGIDVFDPEPPPADLALLRAPNVVLSPHAAGVTRETVLRIAAAALDNVRRVAAGQPPLDVVAGPARPVSG